MHPLKVFITFVVSVGMAKAGAVVATVSKGGSVVVERPESTAHSASGVFVAAVPKGGTSVIERPAPSACEVSTVYVAAVPLGGSVVIERPELVGCDGTIVGEVDVGEEILKRDSAAARGVPNGDKTITETPSGTTTVYVTDSPMPTPAEDIAAITTTTMTATANPAYDLILEHGTAEEDAIVTTTAIVEATVITTVTAVGYSGGSSFSIMSGLQPSICESHADTSCITVVKSDITSVIITTDAVPTTSTNYPSEWSSELSAITATKPKTPAMVTVTSTSTEQLPGASSTVHFPTNAANEIKGGNEGLNKVVGMVLCFMLGLML